ncbi:MAG: transporter associated domain-containing protein [Succinivibrio sp.]
MHEQALTHPTLLFDMLWVMDPTAWVGLLTLTAIQIVLGIDNLLFIAILSARLPAHQGKLARNIGLGGALVIRIILMIFAAYVMAIARPLFTVWEFDVSVRDLMMFLGGAFLIYKSTEELHSKLEYSGSEESVSVSKSAGSSFAIVATQIMILDALFSGDSIITAVGMTNHVYIMIISVTISMLMLMWASGFIADFVSRHPTVVILCLGFLLLIGFSLIMEAFHIAVPKGYLYSAIGFSLLIEVFNQVSRKNVLKLKHTSNMQSRQVAAHMVLRLLGSKDDDVHSFQEAIVSRPSAYVFNKQEKEMVSRVLELSSLPVKAVMTARTDLQKLNVDRDRDYILNKALKSTKTSLIAYRDGQKDQPLGYVSRADLLGLLVNDKADAEHIRAIVQEPIYLPQTINILSALEQFRQSKRYFGFVFDEFGCFEGIVTIHDIIEEITGEMPEKSETPEIVRLGKNDIFRIDGDAILTDVARTTGLELPPSEHYQTIAGYVLDRLQRVPKQGELLEVDGWLIEVFSADATGINVLKLIRNEASKT